MASAIGQVQDAAELPHAPPALAALDLGPKFGLGCEPPIRGLGDDALEFLLVK